MTNINDTALFQAISNDELLKILNCSKAKERTYEASEYIFEQGDTPSNLYLLLEGQVHIVKDFSSGKRDVLYSVSEGNVFGELFLFQNKKQYWYDAIAITKVKTLEIPWDFLYHFCSNACPHHQQITQNMLEILSGNNFTLTKKLHLISTPSLRGRIAIWLIDSADGNNMIQVSMTREQLADFLGVTRPSLCRELMKMQKDGLITVSRRVIRILDKDALEQLYG